MLWYLMACAVLSALLCLTIAATRIPTPAIAAIDLAALVWLAALGVCVLGGCGA